MVTVLSMLLVFSFICKYNKYLRCCVTNEFQLNILIRRHCWIKTSDPSVNFDTDQQKGRNLWIEKINRRNRGNMAAQRLFPRALHWKINCERCNSIMKYWPFWLTFYKALAKHATRPMQSLHKVQGNILLTKVWMD